MWADPNYQPQTTLVPKRPLRLEHQRKQPCHKMKDGPDQVESPELPRNFATPKSASIAEVDGTKSDQNNQLEKARSPPSVMIVLSSSDIEATDSISL